MGAYGWQRTGQDQHVTAARQEWNEARANDRIRLAELAGDHVWIASVAYFVDPPLIDGARLDADALLFRPAVGCWRCEEPWHPAMMHRRCKGDPR